MNYEKKLALAKEALESGSYDKKTIEYLFPELKKESEDEKVKRILHSISSKMSFHLPDIFTEEEFQCFDTWSNAWLEKQTQNNMGISETTKQKLKDNLNKALEKETPESWNEFFKEQSEQKSATCSKENNKYELPDIKIQDTIEVSSRMKYIDDDLKPIAEFIMNYASWNLHKDEWNQPVLEVPLFRVLDALAQRGKPYCCG